MRFVSIDVETANPKFSSICQIGLVKFDDGIEVASDSVYVNPKDYFDPLNEKIHGITKDMVSGAPTFSELHGWLNDWLSEQIVTCHTTFDRVAISQASERSHLPAPQCTWLDTARVARRTWSDVRSSGYGLASMCDMLAIDFQHHDALHDARACGKIMLSAIDVSGVSLDAWVKKSMQRIGGKEDFHRTGDGDGALLGEVIAFTGALCYPRRQAADMAAAAGADVEPGVTKRTSLLVVGDQDIAKLGGKDKSSKHLKAEKLIGSGADIRIIGESDFLALAAITE